MASGYLSGQLRCPLVPFPTLSLCAVCRMSSLWRVIPLALFSLVFAEVLDADDTNVGMFYSGAWIPNGDPNAFGKHDTWTNQSGASVTFDFIGTQIRVFVTRRPVGTYLSNASFSIDGGPPTFWTTSDPVPAISYRNLVYTSRALLPAQHRITVTNLGAFFWLDYMEYTVPNTTSPGNGSSLGTGTSSTISTTTLGSAGLVGPSATSEPNTVRSNAAPNTGTIVGIVVGVVGGVALLAAMAWWLRRRSRAQGVLAATPFAGPPPHLPSSSAKERPADPIPPLTLPVSYLHAAPQNGGQESERLGPYGSGEPSNAVATHSSDSMAHSEIILEAIPEAYVRGGPPPGAAPGTKGRSAPIPLSTPALTIAGITRIFSASTASTVILPRAATLARRRRATRGRTAWRGGRARPGMGSRRV
ncbi:hypothetical protein C8Q77DRAFT_752795 [Trametes polyzona]|nr:hypothetical protein C8Q77DRAFT_752795 [Trametes polyzona]